MFTCNILWGLCSQNFLWGIIEKMFIESEDESFLFTYCGIYIFLSLVNSLERKMFCFLLFGLLKLRRPDNESFD